MQKNHSATITTLSHDGRGIAHINGKITFIDNALPGEEVTFAYTKRRGKYDEGRAIEIHDAAPERAIPHCQHYGICGGCSLQHMNSSLQLQIKQQMLLDQLQHFGGIKPDTILPPLTGPLWGYRRKARLGVKYVIKKEAILVGFREKNGRYLADINRCEVLHPTVGNLFKPLKELITHLQAYQHIPQIEVAISDTATALVFRHMVPLTANDQEQLIRFAQTYNIELFLQPGGPQTAHLLWPQNQSSYLHYTLETLTFAFQPTGFTQINADINRAMVKRALELLAPQATDRVLDLFCGLGNFTLPLAQHCQEAVGVEGDAELIQLANKNAIANNITNTQFFQADLTANFIHNTWAKQPFHKALLDPPRTGAFEAVQQLAALKVSRIVYVSCNPATLARDAGELTRQGYRLVKTGIMDMFPHTHHVEAIALLER